jgi:hypothetical protein
MTTPTFASAPIATSGGFDIRPVLVRFTIALNRRRAYAPTHPMVSQAEAALHEALQAALSERTSFTIGVAHRELLVDQVPVEHGGATARELAERLHRRGVGAITLSAGLSVEALQRALAWLAHDPHATTSRIALSGTPAGGSTALSEDEDTPPTAAGLAIGRIAYGRLAMSDDEGETDREIATLWRSLAAVAFDADVFGGAGRPRGPETPTGGASEHNAGPDGSEASAAPGGSGDPLVAGGEASAAAAAGDPLSEHEVARLIAERGHDDAFIGRVGSAVHSIALRLRVASPAVRQEVSARLRAVLAHLSQSELGAIIRAAGQADAQRQFISALLDVMPASAIVEWLELTANATDQQLSHHLLRILTKLSVHAGQQKASADTPDAFRDATQALVAGWALDDPNPIAHGELLDFIASTDRSASVTPADAAAAPPPDLHEHERPAPDELAARLVQMACEIDVAGSDAMDAAQALVVAGHTALLFSWLEASPGREAARALHAAVTAPDTLLRALLREPFDASAARALLADLDVSAAPALLDALERARPRSARRILLTTLTAFGPALVPLLLHRLDAAPPWYFIRNLLLLLRDVSGDIGTVRDGQTPHRNLLTFLRHEQEQVRLEALRLLLELPTQREAAIRQALDDRSERVVALAIDAIVSDASPTGAKATLLSRDIAAKLMRLVDAQAHEPELHARAIRALAYTSNPLVRDWLLPKVRRTSRILRRPVLADAHPTVLAALHVLASRYATDPRVAPMLALARARDARDPRRLAVDRLREGDDA